MNFAIRLDFRASRAESILGELLAVKLLSTMWL